MRITESRLRQIIREALLVESAGGGDVDARFAGLTNANPLKRARAAEDVQPLVDRAREALERGDARRFDPELALEGLTRFQRISEISGRMPTDNIFRVGEFWHRLNLEMVQAGLGEVRGKIEAQKPNSGAWKAWEADRVAAFETARVDFLELYEAIMVHLQTGFGSPMSRAANFARSMRALDSNPGSLDTLEALRDATKDLPKFFSDPNFEDYHDNVIDMITGGPASVLQAAELVGSLMM